MPEKPLFGSKMHLAVDQGSGLVRQAILPPAHVSDKTPFLAHWCRATSRRWERVLGPA